MGDWKSVHVFPLLEGHGLPSGPWEKEWNGLHAERLTSWSTIASKAFHIFLPMRHGETTNAMMLYGIANALRTAILHNVTLTGNNAFMCGEWIGMSTASSCTWMMNC